MFYGCWAWREYPKWFCRRHFVRITTVDFRGAAPHRATFYHWRRNPLAQEMFYDCKDNQDLVLMYLHKDEKPDYADSDSIKFYETDMEFFKVWIGQALWHGEMDCKAWTGLDRFCYEKMNPGLEY